MSESNEPASPTPKPRTSKLCFVQFIIDDNLAKISDFFNIYVRSAKVSRLRMMKKDDYCGRPESNWRIMLGKHVFYH